MVRVRVFVAVVFSSLLLVNACLAASGAEKSMSKAPQTPQKSSSSATAHVLPQAPIVMGRSVSVHHKTKLHHLKIKPLEATENEKTSLGQR